MGGVWPNRWGWSPGMPRVLPPDWSPGDFNDTSAYDRARETVRIAEKRAREKERNRRIAWIGSRRPRGTVPEPAAPRDRPVLIWVHNDHEPFLAEYEEQWGYGGWQVGREDEFVREDEIAAWVDIPLQPVMARRPLKAKEPA